MPITPTNQSKNAISPSRTRKTGIYLWGDSDATWGDATATWGDFFITPTNQSKNAVSPTNQSKN